MYDDKHHFGRERMLKDLNNIYIRNKIYEVDKYFKTCYFYGMNRIDNQLLVDSLQPIPALLQPMYMISLDFVVEFLIVSSRDTL